MSKSNSANSIKLGTRKYKLSRRSLLMGGIASLAGGIYSLKPQFSDSHEPLSLERLSQFGDTFTFALVADPQLGPSGTRVPITADSRQNLIKIINEINALEPQPAFVLVNGDLVADVDPRKVKNFMSLAKQLRPLTILVHGNHDGRSPYVEFKQMQQELNRTEMLWGAFDCGQWHFIMIPCNFNSEALEVKLALDWLEADLRGNRHKPVMVFEHYHLMPQGLSQLEWYTYDKSFRKKIVDLFAQYDNVRYVICGHVHNGIQTSVKTAWTYKNINFITAPTCIGSRNFGEEYPEYAAGFPHDRDNTGGGYYLLANITGKSLQIRGRLAGVSKEHIYSDRFRQYQDEEPLWFKDIVDYPPNRQLINPSFSAGLAGWMHPYRYMTDEKPGYVIKTAPNPVIPSQRTAYLFCREKGQAWATDELIELYQLVEVPPSASPVLKVHYYPEAGLIRGGGYIRLCGFLGSQLQNLVLLSWDDGHEFKSQRVAQNSYYTATGKTAAANILIRMGAKKRAFFYKLPATPNTWHTVQINVQRAWNQILETESSKLLNIDKVTVAIGVWALSEKGSRSGAFFGNLAFELDTMQEALVVNNQVVAMSKAMFQTNFGKRRNK